MNVLSALRRAGRIDPDRIAVRFGCDEISYADLLGRSARFAGFLDKQGVGPGDRVGILMHNQPEWLVAALGVWQVGAVVVPYNYLFHPAAIRHTTIDSGVRMIVAPSADVDRLRFAFADESSPDRIISVGQHPDTVHEFGDALRADPLARTAARLDGDDAVLMYTSGSTGRPKGVRQTHRNCVAAAEAAIDAWDLTPADHALVTTPLFHVGGLQLIALPVLLAGGTVTLRRWDAAAWLDDAAGLRPTVAALVPAMLYDILNHLGEHKVPLPDLRVCAVGGSALPAEKIDGFTRATGVVPFSVYGQTEQCGASISEPLDQARRIGSLGLALGQIAQVRIVDLDRGEDVLPGEVGELWVRGDTVTPGYWQLPTVDTEKRTVDGWFRTSDLVRADSDGYLYYVDRTDDLIISGGENVFPQMVEGFLLQCDLVAEVAVIGTAHERLSQQVTAIVVPAQPNVTAADIAAFCDEVADLRGLQRPRRIEIVPTIPRTATNKIDRQTLKTQFR